MKKWFFYYRHRLRHRPGNTPGDWLPLSIAIFWLILLILAFID